MANWPFTQGVHDIGNGVYGYVQPDGTWGWSNAGLIVSDGETLLVDTLMSVPLTRDMLDDFRRVPGGDHIDRLVNTHANPDHFFGNGLVADAEIIATSETKKDMAGFNPKMLAGVSFSGPVESNYQITIPDLFESRPSPIDLAYKGLFKGRMLGLYGDNDGQAPVAHIERMKKALLEGGDTKSKISVYPKAGHGIISDFRLPTSAPAFAEGMKWLKDHGLTY